MTHTGKCGRCPAPTGSVNRAFCDSCRQLARPKRRVVVQPKRGKYKPVPFRELPPMPASRNLSPRSWWAGVTREQLSAAVVAELPRMANSDLGRARGGLSQDIY